MFSIKMSDDANARLKTLLEEEGGDMCIRLRETQEGTPCKRRIVLRLSIDEREDEDVESQAAGLPFVTTQDILDQYGENFEVSMDENGMPIVKAAS